MKTKTLVAMAALALLVALPARAEQVVVSSNTVGYSKVRLSSRLTMMAASFQDVGADDVSISLSSIVPDSSVTGIDWTDDEFPFGASLQIWNGSSYVGGIYYWTGEVPREIGAAMEEDLKLPAGSYNNIWVDKDYNPATDVFPAGTAFWIQDADRTASATALVTVSGEVPPSTIDRSVEATTRLTMMGNPYPKAISTSALVVSNLEGIDWTDDEFPFGSSLQKWNGSSYAGGILYWTGEVPREIGEAMEEDLKLPAGSYNNIWVDKDYNPASLTIDVGQGFWIQNTDSSKQATITFPEL